MTTESEIDTSQEFDEEKKTTRVQEVTTESVTTEGIFYDDLTGDLGSEPTTTTAQGQLEENESSTTGQDVTVEVTTIKNIASGEDFSTAVNVETTTDEEKMTTVAGPVSESTTDVITTERAAVTEGSQTETSTDNDNEVPATTESTSVEFVTGDVTDVTTDKDYTSTTENIVEITTDGNVIGDETSPQTIVGTIVDTVSSTISSILGFTDEQSAANDKVDVVPTTEADVTTEEVITDGSNIYYDDTYDDEYYEEDAVTISGENSTPSIVSTSDDTKIDTTTIGVNVDATTENDKEYTTSSETGIETSTSGVETTSKPEQADTTNPTTAAQSDVSTAVDDIVTDGQTITEKDDITTQTSDIETTNISSNEEEITEFTTIKGGISSEGFTTSQQEVAEDATTVPTVQDSTPIYQSTEDQTEKSQESSTTAIDQTTTLSESSIEIDTTTSNTIIEGETCMTEFGIVYQHLENVASVDPCQLCQCVNGSIICAVQDCPLPESPDCIPVQNEENECCPKYACPVVTATPEETTSGLFEVSTAQSAFVDNTEPTATSVIGITEETDNADDAEGVLTTAKPTIEDNTEVTTTSDLEIAEDTDKVDQSTESSTESVITSLSPSTSDDKTDATPDIPSTTITIDGFVVGMSSTSESGVSDNEQMTTEVASDENGIVITTVSPVETDQTTEISQDETVVDESNETATTEGIYYDDAGSDDYQTVTDENDEKICVTEDGSVYNHLANVPSNDPCKFCQCADGEVVCATRDCPPPSSDSCTALPIPEGQCCPKYDCTAVTEGTTTIGTTDVELTTGSELSTTVEIETNTDNVSEGTTLQSTILDLTTINDNIDSSTLPEDLFTSTGSIPVETEDIVTDGVGIVFPEDDQVISSTPESNVEISTETEETINTSTPSGDKDTTEKVTESTNLINAVTSVEDILLEGSSVSTEASEITETVTDGNTIFAVEGNEELSTQTNVDITTAELITNEPESILSEISDLTPELGVSPLESGQEGVVTIESTEDDIQSSTILSVGATEATLAVTEIDSSTEISEATDGVSESYITDRPDGPYATITDGSTELDLTTDVTENYISSGITESSSTEETTGTTESTVTEFAVADNSAETTELFDTETDSSAMVTDGPSSTTESSVTSTDYTIIDVEVDITESSVTDTELPSEVTEVLIATTESVITDSTITDGLAGITESIITGTDSPAVVSDGPQVVDIEVDITESSITDTELPSEVTEVHIATTESVITDSTITDGLAGITESIITGTDSPIVVSDGPQVVDTETEQSVTGTSTELGTSFEIQSTTDSTTEEETETVTVATTSEEITTDKPITEGSTDVVEITTVVTDKTEIVTTAPNPVVCLILGGPECQTPIGGDEKEDNGTFIESTEPIVKPEGVCFYDGQFYQDFEDIPSANPCDLCYCNYGEIICATRECLKPLGKENCTALPTLPGECCPTKFDCDKPALIPDVITIQPPSPPSLDCFVNGEIYLNGSQVPALGVCDTTCTCSYGTIDCEKLQCHPAPQHLQCTEVYVEGECCPSFECIGDVMPGPEPASHMESTMATDLLEEEIGVGTELTVDTATSTDSENIETTTLSQVSTKEPTEDITTVSGLESTTSYDITATVNGELEADATNFPPVEIVTAGSVTSDQGITEQGDLVDTIMTTTEIFYDSVDDDYVEPGSCIKAGIVYSDFEDVPDSDPCNLCQCYNGTIVCAQMECPDQYNGCKPVYTEGKCCPTSFDCSPEETGLTQEIATDSVVIVEGDSSTTSGLETTFASEMDKMTTTSYPILTEVTAESVDITTTKPEINTEVDQTTFSSIVGSELTTEAGETSETEEQTVGGTTETEMASTTAPNQDASSFAEESTEVTTVISNDTESTGGVTDIVEGSEATTSVNELSSADSVTEGFMISTTATKDDNLDGGAIIFPTELSPTDTETKSPLITTSEYQTETTESASSVVDGITTSTTMGSPIGTTFANTDIETETTSVAFTDSPAVTTFAPTGGEAESQTDATQGAFTETGSDIPAENISAAVDGIAPVTTEASIVDTDSPMEFTSEQIGGEPAFTTQASADTDSPAPTETTSAKIDGETVVTTEASAEASTGTETITVLVDEETDSPVVTPEAPKDTDFTTETISAPIDGETELSAINEGTESYAEITTAPIDGETEMSAVDEDTDSPTETTSAPIDVETELSAVEEGTESPTEITTASIDGETELSALDGVTDSPTETTSVPIDEETELSAVEEGTESPSEITTASINGGTELSAVDEGTDFPTETTSAPIVGETELSAIEEGTESPAEITTPSIDGETELSAFEEGTESPAEITTASVDGETELSAFEEGTESPTENTSEYTETETESNSITTITTETELPIITTSEPVILEASTTGTSAVDLTTENTAALDSTTEVASIDGETETATPIEVITDSLTTESSSDNPVETSSDLPEFATASSIEEQTEAPLATTELVVDTETDISVTSSETSAETGTALPVTTGNEQETDLSIVTTAASGTDASVTTFTPEVETESPVDTTESATGVDSGNEQTTETDKNTESSIVTTAVTEDVAGENDELETTASAGLETEVSEGVTDSLISTTVDNVEATATTMTPTTKKPMSTDFCLYKGMIIANLADVPSKDPCELCQCVEGKIICAKQECPAPPQENCKSLPVEAGVCCPKYDCSEEITESSSESDFIKTTISSNEVLDDDTDDYISEGGEVGDDDNVSDVDALIVTVETTLKPVISAETTLRPLLSSPKPVSTTQLTTLITTTLADAGYETTVTPAGIPLNEDGTYGTASSALGDYVDYDNIDFGEIGPGACLFEGKIYVSAQQIPRDNPCDFCFCFRGDIICLQQSCPPPIPGCSEEIIPGFCCPRYECPVKMSVHNVTRHIQHMAESPSLASWFGFGGSNVEEEVVQAEVTGCEVEGNFYEAGAIVDVKSGPCLRCK